MTDGKGRKQRLLAGIRRTVWVVLIALFTAFFFAPQITLAAKVEAGAEPAVQGEEKQDSEKPEEAADKVALEGKSRLKEEAAEGLAEKPAAAEALKPAAGERKKEEAPIPDERPLEGEKKEESSPAPQPEAADSDQGTVIKEETNLETGRITQTIEKKVENSESRISVISDIHVLPEEMIANTEDFQKAKNSDRKYLEESVGLLKGAIQLVEKNGSTILFVTGDLTKDGEKLSHARVAEILEKWVADGKAKGESRRVFLVTGNHDINNHNGRDYSKTDARGHAQEAERTNPDDFIEKYKGLVYGQKDVEKYNQTHWYKDYLKKVNQDHPQRKKQYQKYGHGYTSYVGHLKDKGLTVIGLDTAIYTGEVPQGEDGNQATHGYVTEAEMRWIADQADLARANGDTVVVLSHHAFIPTFKGQEKLLFPYIVQNWNLPFHSEDRRLDGKTPGEVLASLGIHYLFTGHLHANDIAKAFYGEPGREEEGGKDTLYQIQTGSTLTYPMPVRHINLKRTVLPKEGEKSHLLQTEMAVKTEHITRFSWLDHEKNQEVPVDLEDGQDHPKYTEKGLVTEAMVKTLAKEYVGPYLKKLDLTAHNFSGTGRILLNMAEQKLADGQGKFTLTTSGKARIGIADINVTVIFTGSFRENQGKKEVAIHTHYKDIPKFMDNDYLIQEDHLDRIITDLVNQLQQKVLTESGLNALLDGLSSALLKAPVETDGEKTVTLQDVINQAYGGYLAGDESQQQKEWMKRLITRYGKKEGAVPPDLIKDLLSSPPVRAYIDQAVDAAMEKVVYHNPESGQGDNWAFLRYLLGMGDTYEDKLMKYALIPNLGNNLKDSFHSPRINGMIKEALHKKEEGEVTGLDLLNFVLSLDMVKNQISIPSLGIHSYDDLSRFGVDILDGMSHENQADYPYAFPTDNAAALAGVEDLPVFQQEKPVTPEPEPEPQPEPKPTPLTGWHLIKQDGRQYKRYYENGQAATGMRTIGRTTYLFDRQGNVQYGWHVVNHRSLYFDAQCGGGLLTGLKKVGNTVYLFDSIHSQNPGAKLYGWHRLNGKDYYFDEKTGGMLTGKRMVNNTYYLFNSMKARKDPGAKLVGWHHLNGRDYYFDPAKNGGMLTGWQKIGKTVYLFEGMKGKFPGAKLRMGYDRRKAS